MRSLPTVPLVGMHALIEAVQTNCHIADAEQAGESSLCIYLLQMREFYRWECGAAPLQPLPREEIGAWLSEREALWASLEGSAFRPVPVLGELHDPFDADAINVRLRPHGLVYGAGELAPGRASFFLGELESVRSEPGVEVLYSGCEHARGLSTPPAALAGSTVLLRRESLQRWLWEKYEAWSMKRVPGPFGAALEAHGLAAQGAAAALQRMADVQAETLVLHELGEFAAGRLLGAEWPALRAAMGSRRADLYLRALRDHLADCRVTLPALLDGGSAAAIHFWFAGFEGVRAALFPALQPAYEAWAAGGGDTDLRRQVQRGAGHWSALCSRLCALHRTFGETAGPAVEALLYGEDARLQ